MFLRVIERLLELFVLTEETLRKEETPLVPEEIVIFILLFICFDSMGVRSMG